MITTINISARCYDGRRTKVIMDLGPELPQVELPAADALRINRVIAHLKRNHRAYTAAVMLLAVMLEPSGVLAASVKTMSGGRNIILLLQKASFWVGMGITIWGIVEAQLDFPGWKGRIIKGVLGYIGILLVPLVFLELQSSLQVDVWDQIEQHQQQIAPRLDPTYIPPTRG
ncbi:hypothetical protein [Paenibacillus methanolicus]|uniref:Uncharacterized protein n=1 Tax=Paenibacillus methanolicus TaxID=582686 RepID=A0A5S5BM90_9BACL|nr:hypothetical protein [Paenibacillus methanolicus]TYP67386.1 hypothetical protein BCM02_1244 [Paenibacillus methanolicus]